MKYLEIFSATNFQIQKNQSQGMNSFSVLAKDSSLSDQNMETLPNKFVGHRDKYLALSVAVKIG